MKSETEVFQNDDSGYLHWLTDHSNGWVLNVPSARGGTVLQHQSACGMIGGTRSRNWTGGSYYKVAGNSLEALDRWLAANWSGKVRRCGHCLSSAMGPSHAAVVVQPRARSSQSVRIDSVAPPWQLWSMGPPVEVLDTIEPRLASWDHSEHPNRRRLVAYLKLVHEKLAPLLVDRQHWALSMIVDVGRGERLFRGHDVENYVTPLVKALGWHRFVYADVTKRVGGGSRISIGPAVRLSAAPAWSGWSGRVAGRFVGPDGKRSIRESLRAFVDVPLASGSCRAAGMAPTSLAKLG